jgi:hypothetical protein
VLADAELPEVAEPVERDDDPLLADGDDDADGVAAGVVDVVTDAVEAVAAVREVPASLCAASTASAATAVVASTPTDVVSLLRSRSARSRSATVIGRFGAAIT